MADNDSNTPAPRAMTFTDVIVATRQTLELISDAASKTVAASASGATSVRAGRTEPSMTKGLNCLRIL